MTSATGLASFSWASTVRSIQDRMMDIRVRIVKVKSLSCIDFLPYARHSLPIPAAEYVNPKILSSLSRFKFDPTLTSGQRRDTARLQFRFLVSLPWIEAKRKPINCQLLSPTHHTSRPNYTLMASPIFSMMHEASGHRHLFSIKKPHEGKGVKYEC
jgi:hypothetical protein